MKFLIANVMHGGNKLRNAIRFIQFMKQQRVKLVKQMKLDSDSFTKYKQEADKQVIQLKAQVH